jgi:cyclopropane fatty-acyl-phospholipid synthase-like methyltransferase
MAVKKTAAKKTAAKSVGFTLSMEQARETKGTFRFENDEDDAPISTLYIRKSAFSGAAPESITVTVA